MVFLSLLLVFLCVLCASVVNKAFPRSPPELPRMTATLAAPRLLDRYAAEFAGSRPRAETARQLFPDGVTHDLRRPLPRLARLRHAGRLPPLRRRGGARHPRDDRGHDRGAAAQRPAGPGNGPEDRPADRGGDPGADRRTLGPGADPRRVPARPAR